MSRDLARNGGQSKEVLPGARAALALLLLINLFNYLDRQVLAAVVGPIKATFFGQGSVGAGSAIEAAMRWALPMTNVTAMVSPSARPRPSMQPPMTPTRAYGNTT